MKILLIVDDYLPHSTKVASKMMHDLALELQEQGHQIMVLSSNPELESTYSLKKVEGVNVLFFKSGKIKNVPKFRRAINETLLPYIAWKATKKYFEENTHEAIIYYSPTIFWGFLIGKLKRMWKAKSYLILRDIFPQWTVDSGLMIKNSPIYLYFKFFEQLNYRFADRIGVMSSANLDYLKSVRRNCDKFEVLHNWTSIKKAHSTNSIFRKQLGLGNKIIFFYGGNIGHAQNILSLISLAKRMNHIPNHHFLFVGNGDEVQLLLKQNLSNLTYLPPVDQETYFEMLQEADIGLFSLNPNHKTHNFPGKLLGYMQYSKPILGIVNKGNDLKDLINQHNAGFIFNYGEEEKFFEAAKCLANSTEQRKEFGLNSLKLLESQFSTAKAIDQILNHFN